jgi:hypothetical protein
MTKGFNRDSRPKVRSSGMKGFDKVGRNAFKGVSKLINGTGSLVKKYSDKFKGKNN